MPRAKDNRKPVGTELCRTCGNEAEFHQVQTGKKKGELYRKGCDCKAIQNAKPYLQMEWRARMTRTPHPMMPFPYDGEAPPPKGEAPQEEPQEAPQEEPGETHDEPQAPQGGKGKTQTIFGVAALVGALLVSLT